MVTVGQELAARGRRRANWVSVVGRSLAAAVVLRPTLPVQAEGLMWLLAATAAADALVEAAGLGAAVRWPNELTVGDAAIGIVKATVQLGPDGIDLVVLSLRLNTAMTAEDLPANLRPVVTSVGMLGSTCSPEVLLSSFLAHLDRHYSAGTVELLQAFSARCATLGRPVRATLVRRGGVTGRATDVDQFGRLVVATAAGAAAVDVTMLEHLQVD